MLAPEFRDLAAPATVGIVRGAIERQLDAPDAIFEVILDLPSANWRLRAHAAHPAQVRLACHRYPSTAADRVRESGLSAELDRVHN
ncbi:hypothetical protein [Amycolatopsis sp. lyj-112]|uniref:hypothetical protein n=1 Tax=Amycolatopsis sp. lyj-112 TaxID=2789288 RepID=UPI00397BFC07